MLWKIFAKAFLLLSFSILIQADTGFQIDAKLVRRFERGCGYSCAQEVAIDLGQLSSPKADDLIAVRFCSKEPLPVALTTAAAAYGYVISILEGSYHYTPERVFFLRAEDCVSPHAAVTATEFWAVPRGAAIPKSVESTTSSRVHIVSLVTNGRITNQHTYRAALKKLQNRLLTDSQAVGIVVGNYYKTPSPLMKQRLRVAKEILDRSKLPLGRYFVRLAPWTGEYSLDSPEPQYPKLFVVEVVKAKETAQIIRADARLQQ
jgi:hypothetical protein